MAQIIGYLTIEEAALFEEYAATFFMAVAPLATLLVAREMQLKRLSDLRPSYLIDLRGLPQKKVVAHQSGSALKYAFKDHVRALGLRPGQAAATLFRAELSERWLSTAVQRPNFDSG